jgi:hypothetical protein
MLALALIPKALRSRLRNTRLAFLYRQARGRRDIRRWRAGGSQGAPPHLLKQQTLLHFAGRHGLRVLVETGTFQGDMVYAMRGHFDRIYSIELDPQLFRSAVRRFATSPNDDVHILQGDSAVVLDQILAGLTEPALFWLDGHYSGPGTARSDLATPILTEIQRILAHPVKGHVLLVDDAHAFTGTEDYPMLDALREWLQTEAGSREVSVRHNIIRILPPERAGLANRIAAEV